MHASQPPSLPRRFVSSFSAVREQQEAKRLLEAAIADGPAHAYLFHGPAGVGKSTIARLFGRALLKTDRDVHPDLYELEPLGDMIRIDAVRELRRDLHMRPFEGDRRVYIVHGADRLGTDASDSLLKDLEEPPPYAVIILIADDLGPISATIRSRCQLVRFRRLSERAVREVVDARVPDASPERRTALARVAGGRLDRLERLLDPGSAARRDRLVEVARSVYRDPAFDSTSAAEVLLECPKERAEHARAIEEARIAQLDLPEKEAEQRIKRAQRGAERDELLAQLEELAGWYRDLVVVGVGAESAAIHLDRMEQLKADASRERLVGAENAAEFVRAAWRRLEEFNLSSQLALEALWIRLHRELAT